MHEGQFTEQIVETILNELKKYPGKTPKKVEVVVGEIYHLEKESVRMHYDLLTKGSPLEGAALVLEEEPVRVKCRVCGETGAVEDHHLLICPECGSQDVEAVSGKEILIRSIEVD